jgi:hypothetical protein
VLKEIKALATKKYLKKVVVVCKFKSSRIAFRVARGNIYSYQKYQFYFMAIWSILRQFGLFYGHWVYFVLIWFLFPVLVFLTRKNLAT